jgi:hypothetical protein
MNMSDHSKDQNRQPAHPNPRHRDSYPHTSKAQEVCRDCGLVQSQGRWQRLEVDDAVRAKSTVRCPACKQILDRRPAGTLVLDAPFVPHRDEINGMARNEAQAESAEHPLERLIGVEARDGGLVVTTTGVHLARRIAHKLEHRFHREARYRYDEDQQVLRVDWAAEGKR